MLTLRLTKYILLMNSWLLEYKFYFLCRGDRCAFHNQMHLIQTMISFVISDSDILETVEKTDIVEFLDDNNVGMIWKKVKYNGNFHVALEVNFRRESAERNFFLLSQIN